MAGEVKPFWTTRECPKSLDPDWVPIINGLVVDRNTGALVMCDTCPCPPCPYCPSCSETWMGDLHQGNYFELWGIPCNGDCATSEPQLLGVYNQTEAYEKWGWVGCYWRSHDPDDPIDCYTWYGVDPGCGYVLIGKEKNCDDNPCLDIISEKVAECEYHNYWHRRATGWLIETNVSQISPQSVIFVWISWYYHENTHTYKGWLRALNCDCQEQLISVQDGFPSAPSSPYDFGYQFIESSSACNTGCKAKMEALLAQAQSNGWTWHGEGVIVHKATCTVNYSTIAYGNWYAIREQSWSNGSYSEDVAYSIYLCAAETSDGYWVIDCNCNGPTFVSKTGPIANYRLYLDLAGVCACSGTNGNLPDRELLLTYPEEFGVDDVAWGNDSKFSWSYTTTYSSPGGTETVTIRGCGVCGYVYDPNPTGHGLRTMYIDYRTMCFTGKAFDSAGNEKTWVRAVYPPGSEGASSSGGTSYFSQPKFTAGGSNGIYDTAAFTGSQYEPFVRDTDIFQEVDGVRNPDGDRLSGWNYAWSHYDMNSGMGSGAQINGCQPTEELDQDHTELSDQSDVEEEAGCNDTAPIPCINAYNTNSTNWMYSGVLTPNFTVTEQKSCSVRYVEHAITAPDGTVLMHWYEWFYIRKWFTVGANAGQAQIYPPDVSCGWLMLNICYIRTNKGFVVKGHNGFMTTLTLPGAKNYPQYTGCWNTPKEDQPFWDDTILSCPADEDMHFCLEDFELSEEEESI